MFLIAAFVAAAMLGSVQKKSAPSATQISAAVQNLVASTRMSSNRGFWLRAGLSPTHHAPGARRLTKTGSENAFVLADVTRLVLAFVGAWCSPFVLMLLIR